LPSRDCTTACLCGVSFGGGVFATDETDLLLLFATARDRLLPFEAERWIDELVVVRAVTPVRGVTPARGVTFVRGVTLTRGAGEEL